MDDSPNSGLEDALARLDETAADPSAPSTRLRAIDPNSAFHEIIESVKQLTFMKEHCVSLLPTLANRIKLTEDSAPTGRGTGRQTYELRRREKSDPQVRERLLEKLIWKKWSFKSVAEHGQPFFGDVCRFIQSYQVPLQGTRKDKRWGKIDLLGATAGALPVVIELKQENAKDTPLRMLAEALAYACAVRKAWTCGRFRTEWVSAMKDNRLTADPEQSLDTVPLLLLAPSNFWQRSIGTVGVRTEGKVKEDAWPAFLTLAKSCGEQGFPVHFVQFDIEMAAESGSSTVSNVAAVHLPGE